MTKFNQARIAALDERARPVFAAMCELLDESLGEDQYIIFEGVRSKATQQAYFAQGRKSLEEVNDLRKLVGLYLLRSESDNRMITWTMQSKHIDGLACDILPTLGNGQPTWDLGHYRRQFESIRDAGRQVGLECGADWNPPQTDWPHYEVRGIARV